MSRSGSFGGFFRGKRVMVTGHTGFKGVWLCLWLESLGAEVSGYSAYLPSDPCHYTLVGLEERIADVRGDVRSLEDLVAAFAANAPEIVFHMAAQPIVMESHRDPKTTFDVNVGGTVNVLEAVRKTPSVRTVITITSDKCYQNQEWCWGYRENDMLGGDDPYSASKACAEHVCHAYAMSFLGREGTARIAMTRAGNVIGGGDWADARIVPDCVRAWSAGEAPEVRNPNATRPWQHVLEPLSGYLALAAALAECEDLHGEAFNFGPSLNQDRTVGDLICQLQTCWQGAPEIRNVSTGAKRENVLLRLSSDKAMQRLEWAPTLNFEECVKMTADWYQAHYAGRESILDVSRRQLEAYTACAREKGIAWA